MSIFDYVIDMERINELSIHEGVNGNFAADPNSVIYSLNRRIIKDYLELYQQMVGSRNPEKFPTTEKEHHIIKNLQYNRILLSKEDIRDVEIDKVLKN